MRKQVLFLYNPISGMGKRQEIVPQAIKYLYDNGCRVITCPISSSFGAEEIISEEDGNFDVVVCCGGDGTVNHSINGIMNMKSRALLGYIPTGSTNDFAVSMGIKDLEENCKAIAKGTPYYYDIGKFNNKYFNYVAAFGAFTDVSYTTPQDAKNRLGHWAYIVEGLTHLPLGEYYSMTARANGNIYNGNYVYGSVSNTTSIGGRSFSLLSDSDLDDGLYEVILIKSPNNILELQGLIASILIQNFDSPYIEYFKTDKIEFSFENDTAWTLDGEFGDKTKNVEISIKSRAVGLLK